MALALTQEMSEPQPQLDADNAYQKRVWLK
jgi:hypothetical protein